MPVGGVCPVNRQGVRKARKIIDLGPMVGGGEI